MTRERRRLAQARERVAHHDAHRHLGERDAGRLGDEGHRPTGARVGFEHEDLAVLNRVLDVDETHHPKASAIFIVHSSSSASTSSLSVWGGSAQAESPECTPASSTCSMMPATKMSPPCVAHRIHVNFDGVFEKAVEQDRAGLATRHPLARANRERS